MATSSALAWPVRIVAISFIAIVRDPASPAVLHASNARSIWRWWSRMALRKVSPVAMLSSFLRASTRCSWVSGGMIVDAILSRSDIATLLRLGGLGGSGHPGLEDDLGVVVLIVVELLVALGSVFERHGVADQESGIELA